MIIRIDDINDNLLKKISEIVKDENITEKEVINEIIKKGIKAKTKIKIIEHLIANKNTYNLDHERLMSVYYNQNRELLMLLRQ